MQGGLPFPRTSLHTAAVTAQPYKEKLGRAVIGGAPESPGEGTDRGDALTHTQPGRERQHCLLEARGHVQRPGNFATPCHLHTQNYSSVWENQALLQNMNKCLHIDRKRWY